MTSVDGTTPVNREINIGEVLYEGDILVVSGTVLARSTTSGSVPVAIADDALVDAEQAARVARSGENVAVHLLGSGHIVRVRSTAVTYSVGEEVYVGNTAGQCMDDGAAGTAAQRVGTCVEPAGVAVGTAGGLVTVILDNHSNQQKDVA